ncbi:hypothetical protein Hamer_G015737 [Homarus americanus]|uniref:Uncharacterized protein n=1 Tax=Homarus americanus TaxID=6706 RepID=A0A8J5N7Q2_HOMAM|nr:hypothetical protein Hamer_G015737 [Homarus americanus]
MRQEPYTPDQFIVGDVPAWQLLCGGCIKTSLPGPPPVSLPSSTLTPKYIWTRAGWLPYTPGECVTGLRSAAHVICCTILMDAFVGSLQTVTIGQQYKAELTDVFVGD